MKTEDVFDWLRAMDFSKMSQSGSELSLSASSTSSEPVLLLKVQVLSSRTWNRRQGSQD